MIMKRRSLRGALAVGLLAIALSAPSHAQDREKINSLAQSINNDAQKTWYAMQDPLYSGSLDKLPYTQQLDDTLQTFINNAMQFEQESQEWPPQPARLRNMARQLVREASTISGLMFKADVPGSALWEWGKVNDTVETLAYIYKIAYKYER